MRETVKMDFANGKQLADALRELPEAVRGEILATALVDGAEPIKEDAQAAASIHRGPRRRPEAVPLAETIRTDVEQMGKESARVAVGTNSPIAHLREFGHAQVAGGALGQGGHVIGHVPAYPFLRPAIDQHAEDAVQIIGDTLGRQIEDAFKKRVPHEAS
jgi:HK97 gp10 family phage protein